MTLIIRIILITKPEVILSKLNEVFPELTLDLPSGISCLKKKKKRVTEKFRFLWVEPTQTRNTCYLFSLVGDFSTFQCREKKNID